MTTSGRRCAAAFGWSQLVTDPRFTTTTRRRTNHDALDELIGGGRKTTATTRWRRPCSPQGCRRTRSSITPRCWSTLRSGIGAGSWSGRCSRFGRDLFSGNPLRLSDTPPDVSRAGPNMGEDTVAVLRDVGGPRRRHHRRPDRQRRCVRRQRARTGGHPTLRPLVLDAGPARRRAAATPRPADC